MEKQRFYKRSKVSYVLFFIICVGSFTCSLLPVALEVFLLPSISQAQERSPTSRVQKPKYVPGEVIIKLKSEAVVSKQKMMERPTETGNRMLDFLNSKYQVRAVEPVFKQRAQESRTLIADELSNVLKLKIDESKDVEAAAREYAGLEEVEYAEPNYFYFISAIPDDAFFSLQYGLQTTDKNGIDAVEAWDLERGSSNVIIGIVDSGVDYNHEDLAGKVLKGSDFVNNDEDPMDDNGHGTHVSGIAAAISNNHKGIAGVCWNCKILAVKSVDMDGSGANTWIANGITYAVDHGARVINLSLGGSNPSRTMELSIQDAYRRGAVIVAASGNDNSNTVEYPAAFPEVIAVGATNQQGIKAGFSNYGAYLSVVAPGQAIYSSLPNNRYQAWSGTSMATPHVAGLVGLILSKNPSLSNTQVRSILTSTADDLGDPGRDDFFGFGRINAFRALTEATKPGSGGSPTPTPPSSSLPPPPGKTTPGICGPFLHTLGAIFFLIAGWKFWNRDRRCKR
ncbi:MAG TPA: S8 family peptidase [Candidatus Limnocylindrales bacterium]|nr:S8 family peptidase [Candidatus Limnocylindrales bacterium]